METTTATKKVTKPKSTVAKTATLKDTTETKKVNVRTAKVELPLNTMVSCKNGTHGQLIYVSKKQFGYQIIWNNFGDEEFLELGELVTMRNTARRFFEDNWILIDDIDVLRFLDVDKFYKNSLTVETFDSIFDETPETIIKKISLMSNGLKETVAIRARELVDSKELDSRKRIEAIEQVLKVTLVDRG